MYGDGRTEGVSPAASQPTEAGERGYLEMPSAGDSVAQNAEAVKRDEWLPEDMEVKDEPSSVACGDSFPTRGS